MLLINGRKLTREDIKINPGIGVKRHHDEPICIWNYREVGGHRQQSARFCSRSPHSYIVLLSIYIARFKKFKFVT